MMVSFPTHFPGTVPSVARALGRHARRPCRPHSLIKAHWNSVLGAFEEALVSDPRGAVLNAGVRKPLSFPLPQILFH